MDLVVWKEKGLSNVKAAGERYQKILANEDPVPVSELEEPLQSFLRQASEMFPEAIVAAVKGAMPTDWSFSRYGVVLRFGEGMEKTAYSMTADITTPLDLTLFDPEMGMVEGYDDSMDIEIID
jgi:hypothetical protein